MRVRLRVTMTDGTSTDVVAGMAAMIRWEETMGQSFIAWTDAVSVRGMALLAFHALRCAGAPGLPPRFEDWATRLDGVEWLGDESPDPFPSGASAAVSPSSSSTPASPPTSSSPTSI